MEAKKARRPFNAVHGSKNAIDNFRGDLGTVPFKGKQVGFYSLKRISTVSYKFVYQALVMYVIHPMRYLVPEPNVSLPSIYEDHGGLACLSFLLTGFERVVDGVAVICNVEHIRISADCLTCSEKQATVG